MVQYRDLNAPPSRMLADVVADMKAQERQSKTGDAGVKDLGETGDIIWPRWDGGEESVREVGENVEAARVSIAELNDVILPELSDELDTARTDLQQKLDAANARIDDIIVDGGGAGNFTTYSINEPTTAGTGEGDQWFRVVNGEVIGQWRWDGSVWQPVTLTDAIIAGIDLSKLVSNGNLSEVVANKMFADLFAANKITAQELAVGAVTAENIASGAIHADEIVGGSFTGETFEGGTFTGGLFKTSDALPGKVEFADDAYVTHFGGGGTYPGLRITPIDTSETNLPAAIGPSTDGLTIFGGRSISGGSSIVQCNPDGSCLRTFRPDGSTAGSIQTSAAESFMRTYRESGEVGGQMQTSATGSFMRTSRVGGGSGSSIQASAAESFMRTYRENGEVAGEMQTSTTASFMRTSRVGGGTGGSFQTSPAMSFMRTYSGNSTESGWVQARPQDAELAYVDANNTYFSRIKADTNEAFLYTRAGGTARYLTVDANGVWAKQGSAAVSLVPEVRNFQYSALWNADQSPAPIMVQHLPGGKLCQAQIRIQNLSGSSLSLPNETWVTLNYNPIPSDLRGGFTDYIETTLPQASARGRIEMNYSTGSIRIRNISGAGISWTNNNSIWFPMRWFSPN